MENNGIIGSLGADASCLTRAPWLSGSACHAEVFLQQEILMSAFPAFRAFNSWLIALVLFVVPTEIGPLEK